MVLASGIFISHYTLSSSWTTSTLNDLSSYYFDHASDCPAVVGCDIECPDVADPVSGLPIGPAYKKDANGCVKCECGEYANYCCPFRREKLCVSVTVTARMEDMFHYFLSPLTLV